MFYFVQPSKAFSKPQMQDYAEDGGYDYYGYDMAMDQWRSQFPDLSERWCPNSAEPEAAEEQPNETEALIALLTEN